MHAWTDLYLTCSRPSQGSAEQSNSDWGQRPRQNRLKVSHGPLPASDFAVSDALHSYTIAMQTINVRHRHNKKNTSSRMQCCSWKRQLRPRIQVLAILSPAKALRLHTDVSHRSNQVKAAHIWYIPIQAALSDANPQVSCWFCSAWLVPSNHLDSHTCMFSAISLWGRKDIDFTLWVHVNAKH